MLCDDEDLYVKGEEHWLLYLWRALVLICLIGIGMLLVDIRNNTQPIQPPRTEVFIACDGTNCTFTDDLEDLNGTGEG